VVDELRVETDELTAAHGHGTAVASQLGAAAAGLRAAASGIAGAAGHTGASAAGAEWGAAWEGELAGRGEVVRRAAENLAAAAAAYRETDEGSMR
jgi:hypothetical protein